MGMIYDNFWLWRQISLEGSEMLKIKIAADQLQPFLHWAKKIVKLLSTNKKVIGVHVHPLLSRQYVFCVC